MTTITDWTAALSRTFAYLLERITQYLPSIIGAMLLLIVGLVVARVLRAIAIRAALGVDHLMTRLLSPAGIERSKLPSSSARIFGSLVFWVVALFFVTAATQVLGLDAFTAWLSGVVNYLPTMVAGALIIAAGFLLSSLARDLVLATATTATRQQRERLGRLAQAIILVTAILVGADQIGIKITFLVVMVASVAGSVIAAVALALSLGARSYVANLIGSHQLRRSFHVGQTVSVAGYEGRILDLTPVSLVLETERGRVTVPAKIFNEEPIVLLTGDENG